MTIPLSSRSKGNVTLKWLFVLLQKLLYILILAMNSFKELKIADSPVFCDNLSPISGKTVLHFSDGILEVDNEFDEKEAGDRDVHIDPQKLSWAPWMWYYTVIAGNKALQACDYLGEHLATFFGITTPKYQYEISEYNRMKQEKQEEEWNSNDRERHIWPSNIMSHGRVDAEPQKTSQDLELHSINTIDAENKEKRTQGCEKQASDDPLCL